MYKLYFFMVLVVPVFIYACSGQASPKGEELLMAKCVSCHSNQITCINLGRDQTYWEKTVARMVDKGMEMSPKEQEAVSAYLAGLDSGAEAVCQ